MRFQPQLLLLLYTFRSCTDKQINDVAVGPALANKFAEYYKEKLFRQTSKPVLYFQYVDDTFAIYNDESHCDRFLTTINSLNLCLPSHLKQQLIKDFFF